MSRNTPGFSQFPGVSVLFNYGGFNPMAVLKRETTCLSVSLTSNTSIELRNTDGNICLEIFTGFEETDTCIDLKSLDVRHLYDLFKAAENNPQFNDTIPLSGC